MTLLDDRYQQVTNAPSDIRAHLPRLRELASQSEHVVELGVRGGNSTTALLAGQPARLSCFDLHHCPIADALAPLAGRCKFHFTVADSRRLLMCEDCDLLFIDTWHTYAQLHAELERHAPRARRWIALHDTETFGRRGEDGGRGIGDAVDELLAGELAGERWTIAEHDPRDNGFTLLNRRP